MPVAASLHQESRTRPHKNATSHRDSLVHLTGGIRPVGPFAAWATFAPPASAPTAERLPGTTAIGSTKTTHEVTAAEHPSANPRRRSLTRDSLEDNYRGKNATAETPHHLLPLPHRLGQRSHTASQSSNMSEIISNAAVLSIQVARRLLVLTAARTPTIRWRAVGGTGYSELSLRR